MTDQQLLSAGERLYKSFLSSQFTFLELAGLAAAREQRTPWEQLGQHLKIAVFRLVVSSQPDEPVVPSPDSQPRPTVVSSQAPASPKGADSPSANPFGATARATAEVAATTTSDALADSSATAGEPQMPAGADPADSGEEVELNHGGDA
jgi:hypothetical protein